MSVRLDRVAMGAAIVKDHCLDYFPLHNIYRVGNTIQREFLNNGYIDELRGKKSKWRPTPKYWQNAWSDIRRELRYEGIFIEFVRMPREFKGMWRVVDKREYHRVKQREAAEIETRIENYYENVEEAMKRWQLTLPGFNVIPQLPAPKSRR